MKIIVADYGMGNVMSVLRGLERLGVDAALSGKPDDIETASHVILPGVGAFADGMEELRSRKLDVAINDYLSSGRPLLGICLGMQMLFDESEEYGKHSGLGFIPGSVVNIPKSDNEKCIRKIPHIGWNALRVSQARNDWNSTILSEINEDDYFYFVHSFMAMPEEEKHILATCVYEGLPIVAAVKRDNVTGCQFHPEKSGETGLKILASFVSASGI